MIKAMGCVEGRRSLGVPQRTALRPYTVSLEATDYQKIVHPTQKCPGPRKEADAMQKSSMVPLLPPLDRATVSLGTLAARTEREGRQQSKPWPEGKFP